MREIAVSSKEQGSGASQINNAVQELVGVTAKKKMRLAQKETVSSPEVI